MGQTFVLEIGHRAWILILKYTFAKTVAVVGPVLSYLQCSRIINVGF